MMPETELADARASGLRMFLWVVFSQLVALSAALAFSSRTFRSHRLVVRVGTGVALFAVVNVVEFLIVFR
jgi:lipopolysaccharide export LptBFGC system permease protein LptF